MTNTRNGRVAVEQRKQDAALRLIERNERGVDGQIAVLNERLGYDQGAVKERTRLTVVSEPRRNGKNSRRKGKRG